MSGSVLSCAAAMGEENVFLARLVRLGVVVERDRLGVFSARIGVSRRGVEIEGLVVSEGCLRGDLKGVLNGERKGLESVEAASIRRRFAAGVDIVIFMLVL